ncbi:hypothetical protein J5N97_002383 [Dioscorea zingiberensis]|uniref:protein-serine/threonine phosphatase n=1 Tax=Dioscorea zingiberensis TaxID=325984 RepID=A0A9D5D463_9LILI|nr:hypothetical protein J5N97_002383 [Dioscorea zingiberensis]
MAEICCEVPSSGEVTADACEPSSRAARRRRMQIRRIRLVSGLETVGGTSEPVQKRQRVEIPADPVAPVGDCTECPTGTGSGEGSGSALRSNQEKAGEPWPRYGMTAVCGRRREMEDTVSVRPGLRRGGLHRGRYDYYGVFDGHGCSHVAVSCRDRMHEIVAEELEKERSAPTVATEWEGVMGRSFTRMDAEALGWRAGPQAGTCRCELRTPNCDHVGSTAVVAVVTPEQLVVANCGDSRAVLSRGGVAIPLSTDHKPDRPDEMERIEAAGGRVIYWDGARVLGVLAMSRAIGDGYLKPYVISEPEVTVTEREEEDECLILGSDGLWDVVTNEMACEIARMCLRGAGEGRTRGKGSDKACSDAAILLTKLALARQTADNVSVVVVDLRRRTSTATATAAVAH